MLEIKNQWKLFISSSLSQFIEIRRMDDLFFIFEKTKA